MKTTRPTGHDAVHASTCCCRECLVPAIVAGVVAELRPELGAERLLRKDQVAERLGCTPRHVQTLVRDHGLKAYRLGACWVAKSSDVDAFIATLPAVDGR